MPLNVLVVGAGICGPAFAAFLQRSDHRHNITVVEQSPSLRLTGQQIDLKFQGIPLVKKLSIYEAIKARSIAETGFELVNSNGRSLMHFGFMDNNKNSMAAAVASDCEIMRGDLVNAIYDVGLSQRAILGDAEGGLKYEFGKTITKLVQDENGVDVTFSDDQTRRYDIVVGADGQGSRTRRLAFGQEANDEAYKSLHVHAAFYSIPRIKGEGEIGKSYLAPGRRGMMTRTGDRPVTQVFLMTGANLETLKKLSREPVEKKKEIWAETMRGSGWQTDRFLRELPASNDFYDCELVQVKLKQLYCGRVVLIGDAGYCPSVMTGMGTTASLVGSYVLAGELARNSDDLKSALRAYDEVMRAPILEWQKMVFEGTLAWPSSRVAVWVLQNLIWTISTFKIDRMIQRLMPKGNDQGAWSLPEYPELT